MLRDSTTDFGSVLGVLVNAYATLRLTILLRCETSIDDSLRFQVLLLHLASIMLEKRAEEEASDCSLLN